MVLSAALRSLELDGISDMKVLPSFRAIISFPEGRAHLFSDWCDKGTRR